ncbi:uncharacterized protein EI90DRAFT_3051271 [Cantharellus anzutake]|uniref:uncharacterized protein n=1 Tax=Cantharellus anzutake TaxID=1750568 RepID=UPI0019067658|nr:uncharacterized protein EI90DRAFT_3051271 [Cantharellus anzutake]KAF8334153.1 hypothetical protein EI90DRAFT_3051271 [Cantharellus anzutake]
MIDRTYIQLVPAFFLCSTISSPLYAHTDECSKLQKSKPFTLTHLLRHSHRQYPFTFWTVQVPVITATLTALVLKGDHNTHA